MIQLYYHTIPVTFDSIGAFATWFKDRDGKTWPVFAFGADVYRCIFKGAPHVGITTAIGCPYCDYWKHEYKCGGSCFDYSKGGIKC